VLTACGLDWPKGVTGRALRSRFSEEWAGRRDDLRAAVAAQPPFGFYAALNSVPATAINWAGESAGLVASVLLLAQVLPQRVPSTTTPSLCMP